MSLRTVFLTAFIILAMSAPTAYAQLTIPWTTIDGGGGVSSGGVFTLTGTIGQPDAATPTAGGAFTITGGFWADAPVSCRADFNQSGVVSVQDIYDFLTSWNSQAGQSAPGLSADFNSTGDVTVQDIFDFLSAWANDCP
jgi:hypothetical protein